MCSADRSVARAQSPASADRNTLDLSASWNAGLIAKLPRGLTAAARYYELARHTRRSRAALRDRGKGVCVWSRDGAIRATRAEVYGRSPKKLWIRTPRDSGSVLFYCGMSSIG